MKKADQSKKALVIDILSESFDENKSVNYVVRKDNHRKERIKGLMDYSFNVCNAFGKVWISDDEQACALVLQPDRKKTTLSALLWDAKLALSVIGLNRIGAVLDRETMIKSFHPKEPFSYLWFIAVKPELQNNGIGSRLLKEIIEESDIDKRPIYLETSTEGNLPWYQNHGFKIFKSLDIKYTLYMLRRVNGQSLT